MGSVAGSFPRKPAANKFKLKRRSWLPSRPSAKNSDYLGLTMVALGMLSMWMYAHHWLGLV